MYSGGFYNVLVMMLHKFNLILKEITEDNNIFSGFILLILIESCYGLDIIKDDDWFCYLIAGGAVFLIDFFQIFFAVSTTIFICCCEKPRQTREQPRIVNNYTETPAQTNPGPAAAPPPTPPVATAPAPAPAAAPVQRQVQVQTPQRQTNVYVANPNPQVIMASTPVYAPQVCAYAQPIYTPQVMTGTYLTGAYTSGVYCSPCYNYDFF